MIRRQDRDIAVVLSMADYDRLRSANIAALLELRDEVAAEAAAAGLTEERLAELQNAKNAAKQIYDGACKILGVENDIEKEEESVE